MKFDGGKAVVQRILQAYGFTMQKQLHDHLGVGNGTVSTWIKRNYFPGEVVIRCALETGADLEWLATGSATSSSYPKVNSIISGGIKTKRLENGKLLPIDDSYIDLISRNLILNSPEYIVYGQKVWLVECDFDIETDGVWLLKKGTAYTVTEVKQMPRSRWLIDGVEWPNEEVEFVGKAIVEIRKLNDTDN